MVIPSNTIQSGKYTSGNEFVYKKTNAPYQGYYYILNNLYYVGKKYDPKAPEIVPLSKANPLLSNPNTATYAYLSGTSLQSLQTPKIVSIQPNIESSPVPVRYFCKQVTKPLLIKETNKETYDNIKSNPMFQSTFIGNGKTIDQAEKELPGLKTFLGG